MDNRKVFEFDMGEFKPPKIPKQTIITVVGAIVILITLFSSFYQNQLEEAGVVLRFGKYVRTTEPGLHFKLPFIESVQKVRVERQFKEEFGFRTAEAGVRTRYADSRYPEESLMLTGDLNVAIVEWIVQYRISDPYKSLFKVRNLTETFRNINEAVMRQVIGDRTVTEVLTVGRREVEVEVEKKLQELCNLYETGVTIVQVVLQDVNPPDPVKPSWDEVNQAQQQRDRLINEALAEYNQVIPRAKGEAEQQILQADGFAVDRVNRAEGDADRFIALYDAYRRAPEVTRKRLYFETMQKVLPQYGGKLLLDNEAEGVLPLLPMDVMKKIAPAQGGTGRGEQ